MAKNMDEKAINNFHDAVGVYSRLYKKLFHSFRVGNIPQNFAHLAALGIVCHLMPGAGGDKKEDGIPDSVQEFLDAMNFKKGKSDDDPR